MTPLEQKLDAKAEAAMREFEAFKATHWRYLKARGQVSPVTGRLCIPYDRALDNEVHRLHMAAAAANKAALDAEYHARRAAA